MAKGTRPAWPWFLAAIFWPLFLFTGVLAIVIIPVVLIGALVVMFRARY